MPFQSFPNTLYKTYCIKRNTICKNPANEILDDLTCEGFALQWSRGKAIGWIDECTYHLYVSADEQRISSPTATVKIKTLHMSVLISFPCHFVE